MLDTVPTLTVRNDVLYLKLDDRIDDPALSRMADCIRALTAFVGCASERHGTGTMMASLIVVAVNMALEYDDSQLIADVLRRNAEMLELAGRSARRRPSIGA
jgi:hypothetical protein